MSSESESHVSAVPPQEARWLWIVFGTHMGSRVGESPCPENSPAASPGALWRGSCSLGALTAGAVTRRAWSQPPLCGPVLSEETTK